MESLTRVRHAPLVVLFGTLSAFAFYSTWGMSVLDGTMSRMLELRGMETPLIPGTDVPLRLHFTGIAPIDNWYTIMVLFFWQAVDGSHPATSLAGVYFLGQLVAIWTLVYVEGAKVENKKNCLGRTLPWILLMHNLTLGCFGPIYFAVHLLSLKSPDSSRPAATKKGKAPVPSASAHVLAAAARYLRFLPFSIVLGFVVPSIWIGLPPPRLATYASQQAAIAIWTPFPVWVGLSQLLLTRYLPKLSGCEGEAASATPGTGSISPARSQATYLGALRWVYLFCLVGSALVHVGVVTTSLSTQLFPAIFTPAIRSEFAPMNLLFPRNAEVASSIGAGVLNFMQWDQWIGYSSVLIWALKLAQEDRLAPLTWTRLGLYGLGLASIVALLGPAAAAVLLLWGGDERRYAVEP
ncbi:hypothetical protein SODALDRAFT_349169 [Sodiomyces alkalinus F11]|uniref:AtmA protein n=1 Tax=Sodiomyces alkalinus (strain CBS 110278 / VKM F-3762 / F11) TaxID=1314773 RepID=A0A3N2Q398_SODAK|nr:hypothetical protein SODALDRAFT_349169 [Sodiomyces alkalinus F11]ROT41095.1 hypothetical protein SODALDRAFT_349169 [Sodiomyces alkalinus F11]